MATKLQTVEKVIQDNERARNIAQRINACMAEVDYIQKEKKSGMNYSIVSHDAVTAKVRPILQRHGVVYYPRNIQVVQNGNRTEAVFTVRFENIDDRSDFIDVETIGYGVDQQDKGPGKAISYGVKYALLKVLGLETGDDPDEVQGKQADFKAGEAQPEKSAAKPREKLPDLEIKGEKVPAPYPFITHLMTAGREFVRTLNGFGDLEEFTDWGKEEETQLFLKQLKRDLPGWWAGGSDVPEDWVPIEILISQKKRDLEQVASLKAPA